MSDDIATLLERTASRVPDSPPPVADLVVRGRKAVRRRRAAALGGAVAAVLVVAGGGVATKAATDRERPTPTAVQPVPAPPAGTRWVGIGRTVFAVPKSYSMWPGLYCQAPDGRDHVTILQPHVAVACQPFDPKIRTGRTVALTDDRGKVTADDAAVARTWTALPDGWLAVPAAAPVGGVGEPSADEEARALVKAGFRVVRVRGAAGWKRPSVTTVPAIGEPARVGSTVRLYDPEARGATTLRGRLLWVGGPAPGTAVPHPGTVRIVGDDGEEVLVATSEDGTWSYTAKGGTYTVTAKSPGYPSPDGDPYPCSAGAPVTAEPVTAAQGRTASVDVVCQVR